MRAVILDLASLLHIKAYKIDLFEKQIVTVALHEHLKEETEIDKSFNIVKWLKITAV